MQITQYIKKLLCSNSYYYKDFLFPRLLISKCSVCIESMGHNGFKEAVLVHQVNDS